MKKTNYQKITSVLIVITLGLLSMVSMAACEREAWDCPECGNKGNTDNYCGWCGHPAPWRGTSVSAAGLSVGDIIPFGTYPQTKEGTDQTPIEWIVLDYDETNHKALLLSKYGLDTVVYYNKAWAEITWEQCTLRTWLNGEFLENAFSMAEQSAILITNVDNGPDQGYKGWNTNGGNNTQDQIFLLSYAEANRYLGVTYDDRNNMKSRAAPTAYAVAKGAWIKTGYKTENGKTAGWWWLRSPGSSPYFAAAVDWGGSLQLKSVENEHIIVRPALWINLESDLF